jgi:hypothetical protein
MLIVLEGVNGVGKTSLAQHLSSEWKCPIFKPFRGDHGIHWGGGSPLEVRLRAYGVPINSYIEDVFMADFLRMFPAVDAILDRGMPSAVGYGLVHGHVSSPALAQSLMDWWFDQLGTRRDVYYIYLGCSDAESRHRVGDRALEIEQLKIVDDFLARAWKKAVDAAFRTVRIDTTSISEAEKNRRVVSFLVKGV